MKKINLTQLKANLSEIVDQAIKGEEIIICRNKTPIAKLIGIKPEEKEIESSKKKSRVAGAWAGKVFMADDIF